MDEAIVLGDAFPIFQGINWNRADPFPGFQEINIVSYAGADSLRFYIHFVNTSTMWLQIGGQVGGYLDPWDTNPVAVDTNFLDELPNGQYKAIVVFSWTPISGNDFVQQGEFFITITGISPSSITTDAPNYNLTYNRIDNTVSGETAVSILNNDLDAAIVFESLGTLLKEGTHTDGFTLEEDPAFPFSTNSELPAAGLKVVSCRLKKDGVYIYNFTVTIAVVGENEIFTEPESLDFTLRKGFNETQTQNLQIINPMNLNFVITGPDWLNFSAASGSASATIAVTTDNSETVDVGTFSGNIEIAYDGKVLAVPASLTVTEFISISDKDFCLDGIILSATRQHEEARIVRITMNAKFHTREKQVENTVVYDIMYQNGSAKTDIGKKVHQMFPRNRNSIFFEEKTKPFDNYLVYKPAEITLKIEELDISYGIKRTVDLPALFLYPGKKPKMFPLFTNHAKRSRVNGAAYIFSYLTDDVSPQEIVGAPVASNPAAAGEVHTVEIEDSDALITWTPLKTILGTDFYKFPQTDVIQAEWQNQNLVPEWFSFKGEYTFSNDYSHIYQENSFTFNNEKFDVRKTRTLKINTGFILKAENDLINEMIESKLCFLKIGGKIYRAFSTMSKLVKEDSALELYQYDLDFLIIEENGN